MTSDTRTRAIEALAEALRKGTTLNKEASLRIAGMDIDAIDANPSAKAALAAWLCADVPGRVRLREALAQSIIRAAQSGEAAGEGAENAS